MTSQITWLLLDVLVTSVVVVAFKDLITRLLTSLLITGKATFSRDETLCKFNLSYKRETPLVHFYLCAGFRCPL